MKKQTPFSILVYLSLGYAASFTSRQIGSLGDLMTLEEGRTFYYLAALGLLLLALFLYIKAGIRLWRWISGKNTDQGGAPHVGNTPGPDRHQSVGKVDLTPEYRTGEPFDADAVMERYLKERSQVPQLEDSSQPPRRGFGRKGV